MSAEKSFEDDFNAIAGGAPAEDAAPAEGAFAAADAEPLATPGEAAPATPAAAPAAAAPATPAAAPAAAAAAAAPAAAPSAAPEDLAIAGGVPPPRLADMLALLPADQVERFRPLVQRESSDAGRQAALQRLLADSRRRAAELEAQLAAARTAAPAPPTAAAPPEEGAETDALDEFPEVAKAVTVRIQRELSRVAPPTPQASPAASAAPADTGGNAAPTADEAEVTALASEFDALNKVHPDWQTAVDTPEFQVWLQRQPPVVQTAMNSNRATDAIWLLNSFKRDVAEAKARIEAAQRTTNQSRLAAHTGVRGTPSRVTAPPDDYEAAFNFYAKQ